MVGNALLILSFNRITFHIYKLYELCVNLVAYM